MKKIKSLTVFILFLVISVLSVFAFVGCKDGSSSNDSSSEPLQYEERGELGYFVGAKNTNVSGEIVIPCEYNGKPVYGLKEHAFENCINVTKVVIPEGVRTISYYSFYGQIRAVVVIPVSITSIADNAFKNNGIYRIEYNGTQSQWELISGYAFVPSNIHVICSDGEYNK